MNNDPNTAPAPLLVDPQWLHERLERSLDPHPRLHHLHVPAAGRPVAHRERAARLRARPHPRRAVREHGHRHVGPVGPVPYTLPSEAGIEALLSALGIGNDHHVVLYGRGHPMPVTRVWYVLRAHGHAAVSVLDGGFERWQREGRPLSQTPRSYRRTLYRSRLDRSRVANADTVHAALDDPGTRIVNALSREQHKGTGGAHYGRPGRIPGSINVPARELVDPETGCFRPIDELRARCAAAGALDTARTIVYCGGGIAATTTAFAMALAGHDGWCVYDNSLLEWSADPARPMETDAS